MATAVATLLKGWIDFKKFHVKMDMTKYTYTTYAKTLAELLTVARSESFQPDDFLTKMTTLDDAVTDFAPLVPTRIVDKYHEKFFYVSWSPPSTITTRSLINNHKTTNTTKL